MRIAVGFIGFKRIHASAARGLMSPTTAFAISPLQQRVLHWTRVHGALPFVAAVTLASVAGSLAMTALSLSFASVDRAFIETAYVIAVLVPMLVAPTVSVVIVRLLQALSSAHDTLAALATTDALTGLPNRRRFFEVASALLAAREDVTLVGMVDVDRFKQINDAHGHATGDRALVAVAERLRHALGEYGVVARIGGDEFALLLTVTTSRRPVVQDALAAACRAIRLGPDLVLDASLGLDEVPDDHGIDEALALADKALYAAKAANRRRLDGPVLRASSRLA